MSELEKKVENAIALYWDSDNKEAVKEIINIVKEDEAEQLRLHFVIQWVAIADMELVNNKEYLISDGEDVTENSWDADDNKWYGDNYSSYMWVAEMPKPPFV